MVGGEDGATDVSDLKFSRPCIDVDDDVLTLGAVSTVVDWVDEDTEEVTA